MRAQPRACVRDPVPLAEWLSHPRAGVVFDARAEASLASLPPRRRSTSSSARRRAHRSRVAQAVHAGLRAVRVGPRILRADTAALSALAPSTCFGATFDEARHIRSRPALALGGCMTSPPAPSDTDYKYVVLGPEGVPVARVITARAQCPRWRSTARASR
jgi:hypothetical protein